MSPLSPLGLFEMTLEVNDLAVAEHFYHELLGLEIAARWEPPRPATWLNLGGNGALGLWPRETGGAVAIHQGRGGAHVHFAILVPDGTLDAHAARLIAAGVEVETGWEFGPGDRAVYCTDPDGNVVELTERASRWDGAAISS